MIYYGNARHSFSNPGAGDDPSDGVAYNPRAARRSWKHMQVFFEEILAGKEELVATSRSRMAGTRPPEIAVLDFGPVREPLHGINAQRQLWSLDAL